MILLWAALSCHPKVGESGAPPDTVDTAEEPEGPVPLFDDARIHEVALTFSEEALDSLRAVPDEYVEADLVVDGVALSRVAARIKGRSGSFRELDAKAGFKVDLDRYQDQTLDGFRKFNLNNMVVDCSFVKEHLALPAFAALGVPASRVAYATLTVNGEPYGLYNLVEDLDLVFLQAHFTDASGNLYDGDYVQEDDGFESQVDFNVETQDYFDLDEGTDVDRADVHAVTAALDRGGELLEETSGLLDWPQILRMLAVEAYVGQVDGYGLQSNNYRVYFDPTSGLASMIPWDLDYSFIDPAEWDEDWAEPMGRLASSCEADAGCASLWEDALAELSVLDLRASVDEHARQVEDAVRADPRWECSWEDHEGELDHLRAWIEEGGGAPR